MSDTATTTTTAADTTTATTTTAATAWHTGLDGEVIGWAQNKGWLSDDPKTAFASAVQAHREAQKFIGAPPEQMLRLPKDQTDEAGWKAVYGRLGVPEAAKDYDLSGVKFADGAELDAAFSDSIRDALYNARVSKDRAADVVKAVVKFMDNAETQEATIKQGQLDEEKAALAKNWGKNMEANKFIASQAAQKLGVTPETIKALEGVVGYRSIMEMFHKIGVSIGEAKFVSADGSNPGNGIMSRDHAVARKAELMADKSWQDRYMKGDILARKEMRSLNVIISGDDGSSYAA